MIILNKAISGHDVEQTIRNIELDIAKSQGESDFSFPSKERQFILYATDVSSRVMLFLIPIFLIPLILIGLKLVKKSIFAWQNKRSKRHPIIAYILLFIGLGGLRLFVSRLLCPGAEEFKYNMYISAKYVSNINMDLYFAPILMTICIGLSIWFFIGKRVTP